VERRQAQVIVRGEANHAGATAMSDRKDALAGAAACILGLEMFVRDLGNGAVLTVGRLENHPNAVNVVPDRVEFTIDFRCGDTETLETAFFPMRGLIEDTCGRRGLTCDVLTSEHIAAQPMDAKLVEALSRIGGGLSTTISGALHDTAVLAPHVPTVMLFVPSKDGISHNPAEFSRVEDIAAAASLVERFVRRTPLRILNQLPGDAFVSVCGRFYEHSPWIAERVCAKRPFESTNQLHEAMSRVVRTSTIEEQLHLIRAHPDLVGRLAREGRLTRESTGEQAAAGLDSLSNEEIAAFERYNAAYCERFGFPFVICARESRKDAILAAFPKRLANSREQEIAAALAEIDKIARLRMNDAIWEG
jgi:2-oxo-4-hydroxy-4-carboxy-5-ureidoimidazoline decarboxylase